MEKRIRRLGVFMLLCFVALFVQLNNIQVLRAHALATAPSNPAGIIAAYSQPRGSIISSDGVTLASSPLAPPHSVYKYHRVYPSATARLFAPIVGFSGSQFGNFRGVESEYNSYLVPHTRPITSLKQLLSPNTVTDNVTLTVSAKLQSQVAAAINHYSPGTNGAAAVVLDPATGAIEAMYSNPTYDPNKLVSSNLATQTKYWDRLTKLPGSKDPLVAGAYSLTNPPGSSFKVVTSSAVLQHRPSLAARTYPVIPYITLPDTGNPPQVLTNYDSVPCGGTFELLIVQSCDANFASIGEKLGATTLVDEAQQYGFNQHIPLDLPADTVAVSNFGTVASFANNIPGLMKSAIGQENVSASALQMAMAAGTVANGGVEMTPHVMARIRDSKGRLVKTYTPTPWRTPISPQAASSLATFMRAVVSNPLGTAYGIFPSSWRVAAKTGTAQVGAFGPHPPFTTDWLVGFAPVGQSQVAIAVVLPNQVGSSTGAAFSGPIFKRILGNLRADQGISG